MGYTKESAKTFCSVNACWFKLKDILPECDGMYFYYILLEK